MDNLSVAVSMKCHYLVHGYIRKQFNIIAHDIIDIIPPYLITVIIVLSYCDVKTKYFGYCCICDSYSSLLDTVYREFDIDRYGFGFIKHFKYPYKFNHIIREYKGQFIAPGDMHVDQEDNLYSFLLYLQVLGLALPHSFQAQKLFLDNKDIQ